jgi:hypothetical protein
MPVGVLYSLYQELGTDPLWMLVGDKDGKHSPVTRLDVDLLKQLYIRLNDKIIKDRKVRDPNIEADILIHLFVDALERGYNEERLTNFMNMVA